MPAVLAILYIYSYMFQTRMHHNTSVREPMRLAQCIVFSDLGIFEVLCIFLLGYPNIGFTCSSCGELLFLILKLQAFIVHAVGMHTS